MKFMKKTGGRKEYVIVCALVVGILVVAGCICPPYYSMNDDVMMKSIMSGTYTGSPDGHAIYMKYPLTGIISLLYRITGSIPWFDLMLAGCFVLAISAVICRVMQMGKDCQSGWKKAALISAISLLCLALFIPHFLTLHYTLVAAMIGSCALFLVLTGGGALWVVMLILCYCIRSQVFFLLLPFLGVAVLWRILIRWKETAEGNPAWKKFDRKLAVQLLVLVVGTLVCMLWDGFMYRGDDWQQYLEYNDSRTRLYDYVYLAPYEENRDAFENAGISKEQHGILEQYALALDEEINVEVMDSASEITEKLIEEQTNTAEQLKKSVKEYYYHFRYTDSSYKYLMVLGYLLVFVLLLSKREILKALLVCCLAGGRSMIWVYLIWKGRFPERIYASLYFMDLMILAAMAVDILIHTKKAQKTEGTIAQSGTAKTAKAGGLAVLAVVCAACLYVGADQWNEMYERTLENKADQAKWEAMVQYCEEHPEQFYFLDVLSMVDYSGKVWDTGKTQVNYMLAGGWMSNSPLLKARLGEATDGGALLVAQNENCYFIVGVNRESDWLQEYCQSRFGEVELEKTDSVWLDGEEIFHVMRVEK